MVSSTFGVRETLIDAVGIQPGESILNMCYGTGNTTFAIAEKVGKRSQLRPILS